MGYTFRATSDTYEVVRPDGTLAISFERPEEPTAVQVEAIAAMNTILGAEVN